MIITDTNLDSFDRIEFLKFIRILIEYYELSYCKFDLSDIDKPNCTRI